MIQVPNVFALAGALMPTFPTDALVPLEHCLARYSRPVEQLIFFDADWVPIGTLVERGAVCFEYQLTTPATLSWHWVVVVGRFWWFTVT